MNGLVGRRNIGKPRERNEYIYMFKREARAYIASINERKPVGVNNWNRNI